MESLQDKAVIFVPNKDHGDLIGRLVTIANVAFGSCTTQDANEDMTVLLIVYANRLRRSDFMKFVINCVAVIGATGENSVLVEVNGVGGVYKKGEDYE